MTPYSPFRESRLSELADRRPPKDSTSEYAVGLENIEQWTGELVESASMNGVKSGSMFEAGDVLFGKLRPYLAKVWAADRGGTYIGDFVCLRPRNGTHAKYLSYVLRTRKFIEQATARSYGSKMPRVEWNTLKALSVPAPAPRTQKAIADYLDHETAEIDTFITDQARLHDLVWERLRSERDQFITTSGDLTPIRRGLGFLTSGSRDWGDLVGDVGQPFVRITNLTRWDTTPDLQDLKRVAGVNSAEGSRSRIAEGDLLVSITADLGSVAVAGPDLAGGYTSQHVALLRLNQSLFHPEYVGQAILSSPARRQLNEKSYGGTKIQLALSDLKELEVPLPSMDVQKKVAEELRYRTDSIARLLDDVQTHIDLARERRAALISAAVTGQIDVTQKRRPTAEQLEDEVKQLS